MITKARSDAKVTKREGREGQRMGMADMVTVYAWQARDRVMRLRCARHWEAVAARVGVALVLEPSEVATADVWRWCPECYEEMWRRR